MLAALIAVTACASAESIADYFPLATGTKWHYSSVIGNFSESVHEEALAPVEVAGALASPISSRTEQMRADTTLYRVDGNTVYLVGYDPKRPLDPPRPVLKWDGAKTSWTFNGIDEGLPLQIKAQVDRAGKRKILDRDMDVLELKMEAVLGDGKSGMRFKQQAFYARGIGLAEMNEEQKVGKKTTKRTLRLIKFEPPEKD
ncbi:MAG TPA: hypothetical protein VEX38_03725 [Fimbriimonadaceae bacterium]|nr:hypothetical protein [Fimbriimonadaceae bacterium]